MRDVIVIGAGGGGPGVAQELAAVTFKEFGLQDANTLEATQSMIESRAIDKFLLNDQEILLRHLHKETGPIQEDTNIPLV